MRWVVSVLAFGVVSVLSSWDEPPSPPAVASDGADAIAGRAVVTVKVIALNDYHGNLESPGTFGQTTAVPADQRPSVGGADAIAAHVARLREANPNSIVVGAGDFIGASPLISSLFHDEPSVETLNRIGLEFNAVGNHEFDRGTAELLRLQHGGCRQREGGTDPNSCKGQAVGTPVPFEGAKFQWLSANVRRTATGEPLLPAYGIKTFGGVRVAFVGMTLRATPTIVTPSGVAGLDFTDEAETVNALVPRLRAQGVESIVVLVHEGGVQTGSLADINGCEGQLAGTPIAGIVSRLDDAVDVVISGHTHSAYNCRLRSASGREIPVTSAGAFGRLLTDIDLRIDSVGGDVINALATNRLVVRNDPRIPPDPAVAGIVAGYKALVTPLANRVLGSIGSELSNGRVDPACNMPAGNLIADSQLAATAPASVGGAAIAFMNGGGVRTPGFRFASSPAGEGDGNVTYGEAFSVQPFGNSLVTLTLTTADLKDLLEEQFAGCLGQSATTTRVLVPSAGFKYTWDGERACGSRIREATLTRAGATETLVSGGTVLEPARSYRVTVNSFLADGGDGFSTLKRGTNPIGGGVDIDALARYLGQYQPPATPYRPDTASDDRGTPRINRLGGRACPTGATVDS